MPTPEVGYQNKLRILYSKNSSAEISASIPTRPLPSSPEKILNAPDIIDNYYFNLLDWGANNLIAIALYNTVYLWNPSSGAVSQLSVCQNDDYICSVSWLKDGGNYLAIGTSNNEVQLWDTQSQVKIRSLNGHSSRTSALAWNHHILSSGGMDSLINRLLTVVL